MAPKQTRPRSFIIGGRRGRVIEPTRTKTVLCFPGDPDLELKPDANWKGKPLKAAVIGASADGNTPWQIALADYEVRDGGIGWTKLAHDHVEGMGRRCNLGAHE